jgi:hypothetical protein
MLRVDCLSDDIARVYSRALGEAEAIAPPENELPNRPATERQND